MTTCPTVLDGEAEEASEEEEAAADGDTDSEEARPHGLTLVEEEAVFPGVPTTGTRHLQVTGKFHTLTMENPVFHRPTGGQERFRTAHAR